MENKKYFNVSKLDKEAFNSYVIELNEVYYSRTESGKSWKSKPYKEHIDVINFDNYFNFLSSVKFFKNLGGYERVTNGYTVAGYVPVKLVSINPDNTIRVVRTFKITRKYN